MNRHEIVNSIRKMNTIERLHILTDIWDEIKDAKELETISKEEKQILLNRLADYNATPESAVDWKDLKQNVHAQQA